MHKHGKIGQQVLLGIFLMMLFLNVLLISRGFSDRMIIDLNKEPDYDLIKNSENICIYYTNDREYHYFFVESDTDFRGSLILADKERKISYNLGYNLNSTECSSLAGKNKAECRILIDLIGNDVKVLINGEWIELTLTLKTDRTNANEHNDAAMNADFTNLFASINWWFVICMIMLAVVIIIMWLYSMDQHPRIWVCDENELKEKCIGRHLYAERSKRVKGFYDHYFKDGSKLVIYCCKESFEQFKEMKFAEKFNIPGYDIYPFYRIKMLDLTESEYFREKVPVRSGINKLKIGLVIFISHLFPLLYIFKRLIKIIDYEESGELIKEVPLLQCNLTQDRITHVCDILYTKLIVDKGKGRYETELTECGVPIYYVEDLAKDPEVKDIKITREYNQLTKIHDPSEAYEYLNSIEELKSIHELQLKTLLENMNTLSEENSTLRERLRKKEIEFLVKIQNIIDQMQKESALNPTDLGSVLGKIFSSVESGLTIKEAVKGGIKEFMREKDSVGLSEWKMRALQAEREAEMVKEQYEKIFSLMNKRDDFINLEIKEKEMSTHE